MKQTQINTDAYYDLIKQMRPSARRPAILRSY